ncbi:hypothetical protein [Nocardioides nanhaiensis]|uniref:MerR family transcriptional regulator n=1 Tax=Nocardioides nanhaiensis TaxID=1476871 RepID=A0ABP8W460_9ACTN
MTQAHHTGRGVVEPPARAVLVDTNAAAAAVGRRPVTIRQWANRGHIRRVGHDHLGRVTYDLDEVMRTAQKFV